MPLLKIYYLLIVMFLAGGLNVFAESKPAIIDAERIVGQLKKDLGGVSLGGGAHTYVKPEKMQPLKNLPIPLVRLEAVPGSYPRLYSPKTGKYDWTQLDNEIEKIKAKGSEIILNIFYTPQWLSRDPKGKNGPHCFAQPTDLDKWSKLIEDIVRHINIDKKYNIKYWEIWNEPSGNYFWRGWDPAGASFWKFYDVTYKAIKKADSSVLVGGFGDNAYYCELTHFNHFFNAAKQYGFEIDFLTVHWYAQWQKDAWKKPYLYQTLAQKVMMMYKKRFGKEVELFWTEWNLHAEGEQFKMDQQAAFMAQALYYMQNSPADGALFFRIEDYRPKMSILDNKNKQQAPGRILKMFSILNKEVLRVGGADNYTKILATRNEKSNEISLMVSRYDYSPDAKNMLLPIYIENVKDGMYRMDIYKIDSSNAYEKGPLKIFASKSVNALDGSIKIDVDLEHFSVYLLKLIAK